MTKKIFISLSILLITQLVMGCTAYHPLIAPCDEYGNLCGPKVKINQW